MKILVTGACGYIGSTLVPALNYAGHHVVAVDSLLYNAQSMPGLRAILGHPLCEFHRMDVRNEDWLKLAEGCDVIIPLAALVGTGVCKSKPKLAVEVNKTAIERLIPVLSASQRVLYPDTSSTYGRVKGKLATESTQVWPSTEYAKSKFEGSMAVCEHDNSVCFRLATVYGVSPRMRMDLLVNDWTLKIFRKVKGKHPDLPIHEKDFSRAHVHLRDVVAAFMFALDKNFTGIYNLGSSNLTKWELGQVICKQLGANEEETLREGVGKDPDQRNFGLCSEKFTNLGFQFKHTLEQGIREVARFCELIPSNDLTLMKNSIV